MYVMKMIDHGWIIDEFTAKGGELASERRVCVEDGGRWGQVGY